jgi:hypothetical protein
MSPPASACGQPPFSENPANIGRKSAFLTVSKQTPELERMRWEKNGGGGGNRTRVRKCLYVVHYVRSLSFEIRPAETRQARFPVSLGELGTLPGSVTALPDQDPLIDALFH